MTNPKYNFLYGFDEVFLYSDAKPQWYDEFMNVFHKHNDNRKSCNDIVSLISSNHDLDVDDKIEYCKLVLEAYTDYRNVATKDVVRILADLLATEDNVLLEFVDAFRLIMNTFDVDDKVIGDHLSRGQISSKFDLINTFVSFTESYPSVYATSERNAVMLGGWYATVFNFMKSHLQINKACNVDIDRDSIDVSLVFNANSVESASFNAIQGDATAFLVALKENSSMFDGNKYDIVFNTSCEHMDDTWFDSVPPGSIVALQTNDYFECDQHVNCVMSISEALTKYPLKKAVTSELDTGLYTRFTIVGVKE